MIRLGDLPKGYYFSLRINNAPKGNQVWIKGDYDRSLKAYSCQRFSDMNDEKFISPNTLVNIDFIF